MSEPETPPIQSLDGYNLACHARENHRRSAQMLRVELTGISDLANRRTIESWISYYEALADIADAAIAAVWEPR